MPKIELETLINAPIEVVFDLSRSIDLHTLSTAKTKEKAIDGITSGLIGINEFVTWQATHFGVRQKLTTEITQLTFLSHFRDEMRKGIFKYFKHDHYFSENDGVCIMTDIFDFASPLGFAGKIVDKLILTQYLTKFLVERNEMIKTFAESGQWKELINPTQTF